jgi:hypothetical protein
MMTAATSIAPIPRITHAHHRVTVAPTIAAPAAIRAVRGSYPTVPPIRMASGPVA